MPKEAPTLYSVPRTTMWFAIVSLILLGSLVWMVVQDYSREWKVWQRKFVQLKVEKAAEEVKLAETKIDRARLEALRGQYAEAKAALRARERDYEKLQHEVSALDLELVKARTRAQDLKQYQDSYKYFFEEYRHAKDRRAADYEKKLADLEPAMRESKLKVEELEGEREAKAAEAEQIPAASENLQKAIEALVIEKTRAEKKLVSAQPTLAKEILNAPMVDFIAPSLRIQQVVLEDLYDDYHFTKVQKVDRCTTCHLAIDQKGFETAPQPFRTHPSLELFLAPDSPHPLEKVGCTICHGGNGHSVGFVDSAHTPSSGEQEKTWKEKYSWRRLAKWEANMLPLQYVEASCTKCHRNVVEVPRADRLNQGRKLAETYGCFSCHKVEGFDNRWRVGPSLENVQSKLSREWMVKWLDNPKAFRPSTAMPQIFHLSNSSSPEDRSMNHAAIAAIAAYLMKNSDAVPLDQPPVAGDPAQGEKLVKEVGCLGCHTAAGASANDFAPELSNLGSKVTGEWLYTWLKDPKHYSAKTRMPNLRLTDQEAADIASYLVQERNAAFDSAALPEVTPEVVNEMVLTHFQKTMRRAEAEAELRRMSEDAKLEFLGKQTIGFQGCFACHDIKGFEDTKPIGTELTREGQKDVHQLDFGLIHLAHTREAWFYQKLKEPRIFDRGKLKAYYEKLRMPQFNFTDNQAQALTTFLLSLTKDPVPLEMQRRLNLKEEAIEAGRLVASRFNCRGCHTLDGRQGRVREVIEDPGNAPPVLDGEGTKVREKWLHDFLNAPTTIRPWLTYRMPTFGFSEGEARQLVEYFAYLAKQEVSYKGPEPAETTDEKVQAGKLLFEKFQCVKCHQVERGGAGALLGSSFLAPDLALTKDRLKESWVVEWLKDPQVLQAGTMMPSFFPDGQTPLPDVLAGDVEKQIEAIRDYLYFQVPLPKVRGSQRPEGSSLDEPRTFGRGTPTSKGER